MSRAEFLAVLVRKVQAEDKMRTEREQGIIDRHAQELAVALLGEMRDFWGRAMVELVASELARLARAEMRL